MGGQGTKGPWKTDLSKQSLHSLWTKALYRWLYNYFSTVDVDETLGPESLVDAEGHVIGERWAIEKHWADGCDWKIPLGGSSSGAAAYSSFFKVWAERVGSSVRIGVKDGNELSPLPNEYCGEVRINNAEKYVTGYNEVFTAADTNYSAYLLCWVDEILGADAEIVITNDLDAKPAAPTRAYPAPANIITHGFLYLGRVAVDAAFNPTPHQDYLQGGTAQIVMLGPCGADVALYLQQGGT